MEIFSFPYCKHRCYVGLYSENYCLAKQIRKFYSELASIGTEGFDGEVVNIQRIPKIVLGLLSCPPKHTKRFLCDELPRRLTVTTDAIIYLCYLTMKKK